jgi:hypothetical protein
MPNKQSFKFLPHDRVKYTYVAIAFAVIAAVIGIGLFTHRYVPGKINFQAYQPQSLPARLQITDTVAEDYSASSAKSPRYTQLKLTASDGFFIYERKQPDDFVYKCDRTIPKICNVRSSPAGQQYLEIRDAASYSLEWSKEGTKIRVEIQGTDDSEVGKFIDSFVKVRYDHLPIIHIEDK